MIGRLGLKWRPWFAWRPILLDDTQQYAWLITVETCRDGGSRWYRKSGSKWEIGRPYPSKLDD